MPQYLPSLQWIDSQFDPMCTLLEQWSQVNSGSDNLKGLASMLSLIKKAFAPLGGSLEEFSLPPRKVVSNTGEEIEKPSGKALLITKRPQSALRVLLCGHMDTVFGIQSPFQTTERLNKNTLRGPGVADMKGGLIVLLYALQALERSPFAEQIGWEVLITPDEEVGSSGSTALLRQSAQRNHIGLVFEPSLPNGSLVSSRKGSGIFTLICKGKAAHAGRDFHNGRNAITGLAHFIHSIDQLNNPSSDLTVNVGFIEGGGPVNVVPDRATCRLNVRVGTQEGMHSFQETLQKAIKDSTERCGVTFELHGGFSRPPKPFNASLEKLFNQLALCGKEVGLSLSWEPTGGVNDGNILADVGLPTIDSLGVQGGNIHTEEEYMLLDSLTQRARLTALFLMKLANKELLIN